MASALGVAAIQTGGSIISSLLNRGGGHKKDFAEFSKFLELFQREGAATISDRDLSGAAHAAGRDFRGQLDKLRLPDAGGFDDALKLNKLAEFMRQFRGQLGERAVFSNQAAEQDQRRQLANLKLGELQARINS